VLAWYTLNGAIAACLVAPAAFDVRVSRLVGRLLAWRPLAWIGLISYGIYLYHDPLLNWISGGALGSDHPWLRLLPLTALTLVAAVLAASISYYLIEGPCLRLKERRGLLARLVRGGITREARRRA
jgi:peptidoglycan/LPS O-acetylase OafA/YrhL